MDYMNGSAPLYFTPPDKNAAVKTQLMRDCLRLGAMLIAYRLITTLMTDICYMAAFRILSGHFADYVTSVNGLINDYPEVVGSTTFSMLINSVVTVSALLCTVLLGHIVMGFSFSGYLRPSRDGAKKGLRFFPACFLLNMISSIIVNMFTAAMDSVGITIPEADFSIKNPSVSAVLFQFLYIVIIAPLIEEIIYRGMILGALAKYGEIPAIIFSALCFGLMHHNIPQAASAFVTGLAYASLAVSSGSILPSLIIHSLNNTLVSMEELGSTLGIPHIAVISGTLQVIMGTLGLYIIMTRYSYFRNSSAQALPQKGKVTKIIYTSPAIALYIIMLIWSVVEGLIKAN